MALDYCIVVYYGTCWWTCNGSVDSDEDGNHYGDGDGNHGDDKIKDVSHGDYDGNHSDDGE